MATTRRRPLLAALPKRFATATLPRCGAASKRVTTSTAKRATSLTFNLSPTSLKRRSLSALYAARYDRRIEATRQFLLFDPEMIHVANEAGITPLEHLRAATTNQRQQIADSTRRRER